MAVKPVPKEKKLRSRRYGEGRNGLVQDGSTALPGHKRKL